MKCPYWLDSVEFNPGWFSAIVRLALTLQCDADQVDSD